MLVSFLQSMSNWAVIQDNEVELRELLLICVETDLVTFLKLKTGGVNVKGQGQSR